MAVLKCADSRQARRAVQPARFATTLTVMPHISRLRGRNALSAFRAAKLSQSIIAAVPRVSGIQAEFWHFVALSRAASKDETARLERILTYGPEATSIESRGDLVLVVPRIGTISPWSSKASDIVVGHVFNVPAVLSTLETCLQS